MVRQNPEGQLGDVILAQQARVAQAPATPPAQAAPVQPAAVPVARPARRPARARNVAPAALVQPQPDAPATPPAQPVQGPVAQPAPAAQAQQPVEAPAPVNDPPAANQPQAQVQAQPPVAQDAPPPATPPVPSRSRRWGSGCLSLLVGVLIAIGLYTVGFWVWTSLPSLPVRQLPIIGGLIPAQAQVSGSQGASVNPVVPEVSGSLFPILFDAQSTGRSVGFAYNIGVNEGQHALAFGYQVVWNGKSLGGPDKGCAFVELKPGWYPNFYILDGRYEVRTLPAVNGDFWKQKLAMDGIAEQGAHYGCRAGMSYDQVVKWSSAMPSPPVPGQAAPAAPVVKPEAVAPASVPAKERKATGANKTLPFVKGDSVYGWEIVLSNGMKCTGGECYLQYAPLGGTVLSGVVNPWKEEIPATIYPWNP